MKSALLIFLAVFAWSVSFAQMDSIESKLQKYKDFYAKGLIDSQEYQLLKAQALGLNQAPVNDVIFDDAREMRRLKIPEYVLCYDTNQREKILPAGTYMSFNEVISRQPSGHCKLNATLRRAYNYQYGVGGNIVLSSQDDCLAKRIIETKVWLYSDGVKCYVNLDPLKLQPFYSSVLTMGRFLAFYKNQTTDAVDKAGAWGGSIGTEIAQATGQYYRQLYTIDTQSGMLYPVDEEYMITLLQQYPDIYAKFKQEKDPDRIMLYSRYLQYVNEAK